MVWPTQNDGHREGTATQQLEVGLLRVEAAPAAKGGRRAPAAAEASAKGGWTAAAAAAGQLHPQP